MAMISSPSTLFIRSVSVPRTPTAAADYVGQNPTLMAALTVSERVALLQTLAGTSTGGLPAVQNIVVPAVQRGFLPAVQTGTNAGQCASVEAAALRVLNTAPTGQLQEITRQLGGAAAIQGMLGRLQTPQLRNAAMTLTRA